MKSGDILNLFTVQFVRRLSQVEPAQHSGGLFAASCRLGPSSASILLPPFWSFLAQTFEFCPRGNGRHLPACGICCRV